MAAATAAAQVGAQVMLVEEEHHLGGHLRYGDEKALGVLAQLRDELRALTGIEVLTDAVVTGRYDGNWIAIVERGPPKAAERLLKARADGLVVAPGLTERPSLIEGNV